MSMSEDEKLLAISMTGGPFDENFVETFLPAAREATARYLRECRDEDWEFSLPGLGLFLIADSAYKLGQRDGAKKAEGRIRNDFP
jgi:hypothetical protein